ncbi:hypothetical protein B0H34DRAFT_675749 [Crassisporium funariophilum]|nr:hypothetical protein B0H34DRAFT_675749 [Crassisporium funariophilum]
MVQISTSLFLAAVAFAPALAAPITQGNTFEARTHKGSTLHHVHGIAGHAATIATAVAPLLNGRELEAREPKFNLGKAFKGVASTFLREDEYDLEAREPKFHIGSIFKGAAKAAEMVIRETPEFDDLD